MNKNLSIHISNAPMSHNLSPPAASLKGSVLQWKQVCLAAVTFGSDTILFDGKNSTCHVLSLSAFK